MTLSVNAVCQTFILPADSSKQAVGVLRSSATKPWRYNETVASRCRSAILGSNGIHIDVRGLWTSKNLETTFQKNNKPCLHLQSILEIQKE